MKDIPASLLSEFNLGCQDSDEDHKYNVYVTTFLGYGANAARKTYETMLLQKHSSDSRYQHLKTVSGLERAGINYRNFDFIYFCL